MLLSLWSRHDGHSTDKAEIVARRKVNVGSTDCTFGALERFLFLLTFEKCLNGYLNSILSRISYLAEVLKGSRTCEKERKKKFFEVQ